MNFVLLSSTGYPHLSTSELAVVLKWS